MRSPRLICRQDNTDHPVHHLPDCKVWPLNVVRAKVPGEIHYENFDRSLPGIGEEAHKCDCSTGERRSIVSWFENYTREVAGAALGCGRKSGRGPGSQVAGGVHGDNLESVCAVRG